MTLENNNKKGKQLISVYGMTWFTAAVSGFPVFCPLPSPPISSNCLVEFSVVSKLRCYIINYFFVYFCA